ncbi:MAG: acyl carrier protein [Akkermansiaceae bacterium]|nr:acyl carrier protein [Akkermansiaceae bacterium]
MNPFRRRRAERFIKDLRAFFPVRWVRGARCSGQIALPGELSPVLAESPGFWSGGRVEGSTGTIDSQAIVNLLIEEGLLDLPHGSAAGTDLFASGLDSMAVMQLIVIVEEKFGVVIGPEDTGRDHLGTPQALAAFISSRIS